MTQGGLGETFNAGTDSAVSIRRIVEMTATAAGVDFDSFVTLAPGRATEDSRYWLDSAKIHTDLGWRADISLEAGVTEMVEWARNHLDDRKYQTQQFSLRS